MAQNTKGLHSVFSLAPMYSLFQNLLGVKNVYECLVRDHIRPEQGSRVLDIGCGTGQIVEFLSDVRYFGYDLSPAYIEKARALYGNRGEFHVGDVKTIRSSLTGKFDRVIAVGVLHHLDDSYAVELFDIAYEALAEGGKLITFDPTFVPHQNPLAKWTIRHDRGKNVRTAEELQALASRRFSATKVKLRHDLLRMPYDHAILECSKATR